MSTADVAGRLGKTADIIEAWEAGGDAPNYGQLEKLAYDLYKRPLALFFMPEPPEEPPSHVEFRSLPEADLDHLSRNTMLLVRKARAFQAALIELHGERNPVPVPVWRLAGVVRRGNLIEQAARVRGALDVHPEVIRQQPDADAALKVWRRAIEAGGIHVFKDTFKQREISGFCLWHSEFPVILINNSATKTRQVFSLVHELAHVLCDRSGISRFDEHGVEELPAADRAVERFCNSLAAEVLVPTPDFDLAARGIAPENASDQQFSELAARYHVSRSVILMRFVQRGDASSAFFAAKNRQWADQQDRKAGAGGSYYATQGAYLSERFLRDVVSRYSRRLLSRTEAAELIGVKPRNFDQFEEMVLRAPAA